jgi:disulfide bond formation protein DsbB
VQTSERIATPPVVVRTDFVHWTPVIAGALVASALSLVLIAFGGSLGLSVASTAPTWRDTSASLTLLSGLYLVLTALVSFGFGGYVAGRLRTTWDPGLHSEFVEFRDGTHGLLSWALAVVISRLDCSRHCQRDWFEVGCVANNARSEPRRSADCV